VGRYLVRRLVTLTITIFGIMVMTFFTSLVVPLDPLASLAGPQAPPETVERLRTLYGFDQPLYVSSGANVGRPDPRRSGRVVPDQPAGPPRHPTYFPATLELATFAILLGHRPWAPWSPVRRVPEPGHRTSSAGCSAWSGLDPRLLAGPGADAHLLLQAGLAPGAGPLDIMLLEPARVTGVLLIDSAIARDWEVFRDALKHLIMPASVLGLVAWRESRGSPGRACWRSCPRSTSKTARDQGLGSFLVITRTPCATPWCPPSRSWA